MRHRTLHAALSAFAEEAAWELATDTENGAEIPFEVVESGGGPRRTHTPLYCYRPLTGGFIRERAGLLCGLPTYPAAARILAALDGVGDYLRAQGESRVPVDPRERADATLRVFVSRVFAEASEFVLTPERLERAYSELESVLMDGRGRAEVIAPVLGLDLVSPEVVLGDGLVLVRGDLLEDAPDEAVWPAGDEAPAILAVLTQAGEPGSPSPLGTARARLARLVSALRLYDPAVVALGPVAWSRTGAGPWTPVAIGTSGAAASPGGVCLITAEAEDELRAFCSLIARRTPRSGELAWALRRFELGCERASPQETLTDHLLALRALLEPEGPASGRLPGRLAALCATDERRPALAERVAHAVSLERAVIAGLAPAERGVEALIDELSDHLRALLRDVLCGHLDSDLRSVADRLITDPSTMS